MTDDRQLLELAAKAAGIDLTGSSFNGTFVFWTPRKPNWNPLTDDGDALRLAISMRISIVHESEFLEGELIPTIECIGPDRGNGSRYCAMHSLENDPMAATRRAIVEAAAEMGKL
jgi:hypothetical protein